MCLPLPPRVLGLEACTIMPSQTALLITVCSSGDNSILPFCLGQNLSHESPLAPSLPSAPCQIICRLCCPCPQDPLSLACLSVPQVSQLGNSLLPQFILSTGAAIVWISVSWKKEILRGKQKLGNGKEDKLHVFFHRQTLDFKHDKSRTT